MSDPSAAIGPIILSVVLGVVLYVWTAASLHAVFRKAGEEGWKAWVPILNIVTLLRLGRVSGWWVLLLLFPPAAIVLWVLLIVAYRRINAAFGLGVGMTVLAALLLPVWSSIVGWGSAQWIGDDRRAAPGPVRTSSTELDARFGAPFAAREDSAPPAPVVSAVPLTVPAAPPAPQGVASAPRSAPPAPATAASFDPAPASATLPVVASAGARSTPAAAASFADDTVGSSGPRSPFVPASASAVPARPDSSSPPPPPPPPPATATSASTRSPMRGFAGPVTTAPEPAPPVDPDRPGPMRSRGGAYAAGYDVDDDADVVDDPLEQVDPYRMPAAADVSEETPPGPRRALGGAADAPGPVDQPGPLRSASTETTPPTAAERDPWAPPATPYGATRTPRFSPTPTSADGFSDTSAEVSAVAGAPTLGEPMAARASVSARRGASELPSEDAVFDQTVVAARRRNAWTLTPPLGAPVTVARDVLIIGRRPSADPAFPGAQLVSVADETRTMSKTHARLELHDGEWTIVDLDSTNGVVLLSADGRETELLPRRAHVATTRFLLGDAELRLAHDDA